MINCFRFPNFAFKINLRHYTMAIAPFFDRRQPPRPPPGADGTQADPILAALEAGAYTGSLLGST